MCLSLVIGLLKNRLETRQPSSCVIPKEVGMKGLRYSPDHVLG